MESKLRIAIVDAGKCQPRKCGFECKKFCPVDAKIPGAPCIDVEKTSKVAVISETRCIGCAICVKKCPFSAISVVNLPKELTTETTHRYGRNMFKLHRLPVPRAGQILGLVGTNGIGKSTVLSILAGHIKPNLGYYEQPPDWTYILEFFKGGKQAQYFANISTGAMRTIVKPQYVDRIKKTLGGMTVGKILQMLDKGDELEDVSDILQLEHLMARNISSLSGGELQRFAIGLVCIQEAEVYMFDEPSSFLDIRQRLQAANLIRSLRSADNYITVVEHDLAVLDYLSDFVCCLWGSPGAYGVVTMPFNVREGINIFLDGMVPTENMRFRDSSLSFSVNHGLGEVDEDAYRTEYPAISKSIGNEDEGFHVDISAGDFREGEIIVLLGENGTGKSTFIRMLAGRLKPDPDEDGDRDQLPEFDVSYKPQNISVQRGGTVRELFMEKIPTAFMHQGFQTDVAAPMLIEPILDQDLRTLSGGQLQRVALVLTLGKPAHLYLIDEPSAFLDAEQRIVAARVMKQFILNSGKTAFIVEHDFLMALYLADRVIVFDGEPGMQCTASAPRNLVDGMNNFLEGLGITFRRDATTHRPRINKVDSIKDREQKESGNFFVLES